MSNVLERLFHVARARIPRPGDFFGKKDTEVPPFAEDFTDYADSGQTRTEEQYSSGFRQTDLPPQVVEDLAVFDLTPPSSLAEVRAARNREVKKYHSDRFVNDAERFQTSKEIMQILNAAYDRLKAYYENVEKQG